MKKLVSILLTMYFVFCGIAYANDYDVNSSENAIGISGLGGHSYHTIMLPFPIMPFLFSFGESASFELFPLKDLAEEYSGYYTQTGSTFTAHCEYVFGDLSGEFDFKGTSIRDIFIYGICTGQLTDGDMGYIAVFFGILQ